MLLLTVLFLMGVLNVVEAVVEALILRVLTLPPTVSVLMLTV